MQLYPAAIEQPGLLRRRIFRVLERGPAVPIGELRLRLGVEDEVLRRELDGLAAGGEIERLRPVNDAGEEHDFYVLAAAGRTGRTSVSSAGSNQVLTKCLQRTHTRVVEIVNSNRERKARMNRFWKTAGMGCVALGVAAGAAVAAEGGRIVVDGSTTVGPIVKAFAEYYMGKYPGVNITVSESGSGNGAKSLVNAACDVAAMSRPMKDSEKQAAQAAGVTPVEHIVAMDGIALVVHPGNPLADLTIAQIRDLYAGRIRNWKDLGGPDKPVVAISRDTNSGTYETFEALVMNKEKIGERAEYVGSNGAIRQRVLSTPAAIGYVGLAFTEGVKALTVNGIEAAADTVAGGTYPVARPLYLYTNGQPKPGTPLHDFISLSGTPEGKRIVEDTGFVPAK